MPQLPLAERDGQLVGTWRRPTAEIMTHRPCTCTEDGDLVAAERLMRDHQIRRLPIVNRGGSLVGMLSLADLAQAVKREGSASQRPAEFGESSIPSPLCPSRVVRNPSPAARGGLTPERALPPNQPSDPVVQSANPMHI